MHVEITLFAFQITEPPGSISWSRALLEVLYLTSVHYLTLISHMYGVHNHSCFSNQTWHMRHHQQRSASSSSWTLLLSTSEFISRAKSRNHLSITNYAPSLLEVLYLRLGKVDAVLSVTALPPEPAHPKKKPNHLRKKTQAYLRTFVGWAVR